MASGEEFLLAYAYNYGAPIHTPRYTVDVEVAIEGGFSLSVSAAIDEGVIVLQGLPWTALVGPIVTDTSDPPPAGIAPGRSVRALRMTSGSAAGPSNYVVGQLLRWVTASELDANGDPVDPIVLGEVIFTLPTDDTTGVITCYITPDQIRAHGAP